MKLKKDKGVGGLTHGFIYQPERDPQNKRVDMSESSTQTRLSLCRVGVVLRITTLVFFYGSHSDEIKIHVKKFQIMKKRHIKVSYYKKIYVK